MVFVTVIWFCAGDGDCYVTMYCVMFTAKLPQSNNEQNQNSIQTTRKQALIVVMVVWCSRHKILFVILSPQMCDKSTSLDFDNDNTQAIDA